MLKKSLLLLLVIPFLFFVSCPDDKPDYGISAMDYFAENELYSGWNLGNALDASVTNETSWGNPKIEQAIFDGLKEQGFNVVRIPISWNSALGVAPDYTITESALNRVAEVVDMANEAGLVAIINSHHDGGASWLTQAAQSKENRTAATNRYKAMWTQIAEKFKDYGEWLIFEPFNEIRSGNSWDSAPDAEMYNIINEWNQAFVNAVRKTGGNNNRRFLIAKAYAAKPNRTLATNEFKLPKDPAPNKLIVSFHYYEPYAFTLEGSTINWNSTSGKKMMASDFSRFKTPYVDKGIPVFIGECGASYQGNRSDTDKATAHANRLAYMECLGGTAKECGLVPVIWDNGKFDPSINNENSGLFNRATGKPNNDISAGVIAAFMKGVK